MPSKFLKHPHLLRVSKQKQSSAPLSPNHQHRSWNCFSTSSSGHVSKIWTLAEDGRHVMVDRSFDAARIRPPASSESSLVPVPMRGYEPYAPSAKIADRLKRFDEHWLYTILPWVIAEVMNWPIDWLADCLTNWLIDYLTNWLTD